ncbi:anti-sigma factor antagonist [Microtetraspora sp. NBRC 13810]|uniref:STAS domain-containing protein n=1 Tax=Microtetraspora sp. NBRC 13810 TaxID=3030990 RepID=UPI00255323AB|nr:STAS domain-containing protein [Microtetraspora sp. NBRC 13810]GLW08991.1 anti-sigma factor antagonist [Microtetraspora sp. NBRC 13810]
MRELTTVVHDTPAGPVLEVLGDLDFHTAPQFRDAVEKIVLRPGRQLVLDLTGLEFCDSSGVTALIAARNHAFAAEAVIALAAVPSNTARILRIVGLDQMFPIHPDAATAVAAHLPADDD